MPKKQKVPKNAPKGIWKYMLEQSAKGNKLPSTAKGLMRDFKAYNMKKKT